MFILIIINTGSSVLLWMYNSEGFNNGVRSGTKIISKMFLIITNCGIKQALGNV